MQRKGRREGERVVVCGERGLKRKRRRRRKRRRKRRRRRRSRGRIENDVKREGREMWTDK